MFDLPKDDIETDVSMKYQSDMCDSYLDKLQDKEDSKEEDFVQSVSKRKAKRQKLSDESIMSTASKET